MKVGDLVKMNTAPQKNEEHDLGLVVEVNILGTNPLILVSWTEYGVSWHAIANLEVLREVGS